jgi:xanthine dehydrogenase molybdopterin-binding subunit B
MKRWTDALKNDKMISRKFISTHWLLEDRQAKGQRLIRGLPKRVHHGAQDKHVPGTNNYIDGRSIVYPTIDVQDLVNRYSGKGIAKLHVNPDGTVNKVTEVINNSDTIVGKDIDYNGAFESHDFTIHYSKRGTHIVPLKELGDYVNWKRDF